MAYLVIVRFLEWPIKFEVEENNRWKGGTTR